MSTGAGRPRSRSPCGMNGIETAVAGLGVARDAVSAGSRGVSFGFGLARFATKAGFDIASACILAPAAALEQTVGDNPVSSGLRHADSVVGFANVITKHSQDVAEGTTKTALAAVKVSLEAAGARKGELLRLMLGDETAETLITIDAITRGFLSPMADVPLNELLVAACAWSIVQNAAEAGRSRENGVIARLPECERWMRFAAASFGAQRLAGLLHGMSLSAPARAAALSERGGDRGDVAIACAGIEGRVSVLAFEESQAVFTPAYMVAVDHEMNVVVVALRGTASVADALSDLICKPVPLRLGGSNGIAHDGMLRAARRLEAPLATLAETGLEILRQEGCARTSPPHVVLCGHSLGAGVASLLSALWHEDGRFPGIECFAFACPQVLDSDLAAAQGSHTCSFVLGEDVVPRLSLATAIDLRSALLCLRDPEAFELPSLFGTSEVLASHARDDKNALIATYELVRRVTCTSPHRLYPAGRLFHLEPGRALQNVDAKVFDQMLVTSDMLAAHMPHRYLLALQEAARVGQPRL